ncbi:extracellular solute-binding protein [Amorphus orientalis]|uniref:Multiple sugar transport system substrate-binding protein n=1 Tax=Amorphus orientalis TaxID=649198 RepID=A0AAE3VS75_9HYPH|nr:extracellular solute-binding protein [Amorphus orientalis]MDQ0317814.1 multiple sugar transport system substrate-binding protein [Amorphus orientalis]
MNHHKGELAKEQPHLTPQAKIEILQVLGFLENFDDELAGLMELSAPNAYVKMSAYLVKRHLEAKAVTPTSLIGASGVPYATANRRMKEMIEAGLIEQRPRTSSGKSYSLHPSAHMLEAWTQFSNRVRRLAGDFFGTGEPRAEARDYYFGSSYLAARTIQPPQVLLEPLKVTGGLRVLVHGDPTFMVMHGLKRQFEQVIGCPIQQRAFSIDRLHEEALKNAQRSVSRYDLIALDLPWVGEFAENGYLMPLEDVLDVERLTPSDFHTAGWQGAHWENRAYGVPSQTTPELLFYRKDLFAEAGLEPPHSTDALLEAAQVLHEPSKGRYGIAWNAARGTALGHTFMMTCADFGQPILDLPRQAGGFDASRLASGSYRPTIDTPRALEAAEYLMALLQYSPPDILSMSWYERVRPFANGRVAMAYGYTLLAPYFEQNPTCAAYGKVGYLPHPAGPNAHPIAPVGGYLLCIPANIAPERLAAAVEALIVFTSPEAQKLYVEHGSRTNPRYSVSADPEVRRLSPIFEAVDAMSWRDELQFWPRPPVPEISRIIQICGEECHDMLRGVQSPKAALQSAQDRADQLLRAAGKL